MQLLNTVGGLKSCHGCNFEKYKSLVCKDDPWEQQPIFKTKVGTSAAFVDIMVSKGKEKVIRSTNCLTLLIESDVIKTPNTCEACKSTNHYLRTMLSRQNSTQAKDVKKSRLDYFSKEDLLNHSRSAIKEMKYWKQKCQRLEEYRNKMTTVGPKTNNDLHRMFEKMYNGILETKNHLQNPVCKWEECNQSFDNVELLYSHTKQHVEKVDTVEIAPVERL